MMKISVGDREIGDSCPVYIVAEIGINHNGDMDLAERTIIAAHTAGADAVKFQSYCTEDFISNRELMLEYQSQGQIHREPQYDLFKRCEIDGEKLLRLKHFCDDMGIDVHTTPTSQSGIDDLLAANINVIKNGSDYLGHIPLIRSMASTGLQVVLSTGMASAEEIQEAVDAYYDKADEKLILLHCTSSYPAPADSIHLRKMCQLRKQFGCLVGFSDHSNGSTATIAAVTMGACWIEKHFTLDKNLPGPDHWFSSDELEFKALVETIRCVEACLGSAELGYTDLEAQSRADFKLSCVANRDLSKCHQLDWEDIAFRRPGTGIKPANAYKIVGQVLKSNIQSGEPFTENNF
ncbi:MAG: N-acetylneuraminate synthase family protein [Pseudomonadales bacterium]